MGIQESCRRPRFTCPIQPIPPFSRVRRGCNAADPVFVRPVFIRLIKLTGSASGRDSVPANQTTITGRHDRHVRRTHLHALQPRENADQHPARQKPTRRAQLRMFRLQGHLPACRAARTAGRRRACLRRTFAKGRHAITAPAQSTGSSQSRGTRLAPFARPPRRI